MDALKERGRREASIASEPSEEAFTRIFYLPRLYSNPPHSLLSSYLGCPLALFSLPRDAPVHT